MKKIVLLLIFIPFIGFCQEEDKFIIMPEGNYELVVKIDSMSANKIYEKAKALIFKTYKNPNFVIKVDEADKLIRFSGYEDFSSGFSSSGRYSYVCDLEFKDGRYKISYSDIKYDKGVIYYIKDVFKSNGEIRNYDYYRNIHKNFTDLLNNNHLKFKKYILSKEEKW